MDKTASGLLEHLISNLDRLVPVGQLGIAVSGGGDSMALLAMAQTWAQRTGREIAAVTVDHGLRSESATEATTVAKTCASLGVPHKTLKTPRLGMQGNLQAEARNWRYNLMSEWARSQGISSIALGHTMDDQAETVLMRLARGSGVDGLSAMAPTRHWLSIDWIRPMLGLRREDLRDWLDGRKISWIDDPTNEDDHYDRIKARQALATLAAVGIDAEGLSETAKRLGAQRDALDAVTKAHLARTGIWGEFGEVSLDMAAMASIEPEIARRIMSRLLRYVSGRDYPPRHRALAQLMVDIHSPNFKGATLGGCLVKSYGARRMICREPAATKGETSQWTGHTVWDSRWHIMGPNYPDMRVGALGEVGISTLKCAIHEGWVPPNSWNDTSKSVRLTLPAVWQVVGKSPPKLAAVPPINYVDPAIEGFDGAWTAKLIMRHDALYH